MLACWVLVISQSIVNRLSCSLSPLPLLLLSVLLFLLLLLSGCSFPFPASSARAPSCFHAPQTQKGRTRGRPPSKAAARPRPTRWLRLHSFPCYGEELKKNSFRVLSDSLARALGRPGRCKRPGSSSHASHSRRRHKKIDILDRQPSSSASFGVMTASGSVLYVKPRLHWGAPCTVFMRVGAS